MRWALETLEDQKTQEEEEESLEKKHGGREEILSQQVIFKAKINKNSLFLLWVGGLTKLEQSAKATKPEKLKELFVV